MSFIGVSMENDRLSKLPKEFLELKKPPKDIWYRGDTSLLERPKISIVGSRRPSSYTKELTHSLAKSLSERGCVVVSGGAMGVDAIAHKGAGSSNTIGVLATGIDIRYPSINSSLIEDIEKNGLTLSRFEKGFRARAWSFVVRNELVVALGKVLIITEANRERKSKRSAEYALRMGKDIYVPSHRIGESEGTQELLKKSLAKPIYSIEDFANSFGVVPTNNIEKDDFFYFCQKNPTLDEAIKNFGGRVYEAELMGEIQIQDGRIWII